MPDQPAIANPFLIADQFFAVDEIPPPHGLGEEILKQRADYIYEMQRKKAPVAAPKNATADQLRQHYDKIIKEKDAALAEKEQTIWEMRRDMIRPEELKTHLENYLMSLGVKVELKPHRQAFTVFGQQLLEIFATKDDLVP